MKAYPFLLRVSSFAGRAVAFFFISALLVLFFYLLGNYQDFLDSTQLFLLSLLNITLILQLVSGFYFAVFLSIRSFRERRFFVLRTILLILSLIFSAGLLVAMRFLQSWLQA
jgi:hypothetical protein